MDYFSTLRDHVMWFQTILLNYRQHALPLEPLILREFILHDPVVVYVSLDFEIGHLHSLKICLLKVLSVIFCVSLWYVE